MSDYDVTCTRCGLPVTHICNESLRKAVYYFLSWTPECKPTDKLKEALLDEGRLGGWVGDDEDTEERWDLPFFGTQAWSYLIFGGSKDTARSFHSAIHNLLRAAGISPHRIERDVMEAFEEERKRRKDLQKFREEKRERIEAEKREICAILSDTSGETDSAVQDHYLDRLILRWGGHRDAEELSYADFQKFLKRFWAEAGIHTGHKGWLTDRIEVYKQACLARERVRDEGA